MKRAVYVAISMNGTNAWISAENNIELDPLIERLGEGTIINFDNIPYTFEVARWEGTGQWTGKTKLHIINLNSMNRATNGLAAVVNNPQEILDVFNVLVNNGWELVESEKFLEHHNL